MWIPSQNEWVKLGGENGHFTLPCAVFDEEVLRGRPQLKKRKVTNAMMADDRDERHQATVRFSDPSVEDEQDKKEDRDGRRHQMSAEFESNGDGRRMKDSSASLKDLLRSRHGTDSLRLTEREELASDEQDVAMRVKGLSLYMKKACTVLLSYRPKFFRVLGAELSKKYSRPKYRCTVGVTKGLRTVLLEPFQLFEK